MENTKAAMVAAVDEALKFKHQNPHAKDEDVIGYVVKISDQIIRRMSS
jgi:hypothetical protein